MKPKTFNILPALITGLHPHFGPSLNITQMAIENAIRGKVSDSPNRLSAKGHWKKNRRKPVPRRKVPTFKSHRCKS